MSDSSIKEDDQSYDHGRMTGFDVSTTAAGRS